MSKQYVINIGLSGILIIYIVLSQSWFNLQCVFYSAHGLKYSTLSICSIHLQICFIIFVSYYI